MTHTEKRVFIGSRKKADFFIIRGINGEIMKKLILCKYIDNEIYHKIVKEAIEYSFDCSIIDNYVCINFCEVNYYIKLLQNFTYSDLIQDIEILENCLRQEFHRINTIDLSNISNSILSKHIIKLEQGSSNTPVLLTNQTEKPQIY